MEWSRYARFQNVRPAAIMTLARFGENATDARKADIIDHVIQLLGGRWFRCEITAIAALQELKESTPTA
jgi:hypothetical protein